jgi:hypothetical protein
MVGGADMTDAWRAVAIFVISRAPIALAAPLL